MAENKTKETSASVTDFLNAVPEEQKRQDSFRLAAIMEEESGFPPRMWGDSIVGFGSYHYKYESGREGDAPLAGFSPRKKDMSIYLSIEPERRDKVLQSFGKHKSGKACIYVRKLSDVNEQVLREMVRNSVKILKGMYP